MVHRSIFRAALALAALFALPLAGCSSDSPNSPGGGGGNDDLVIAVDVTVDPVMDTLPDAAGNPTRPIAAIADDHGHQAEFVENELWIRPAGTAELDDFVDRWNGTILQTYDPADYGLPATGAHYLVRVDVATAAVDSLIPHVMELSGAEAGNFRVSSEDALRLITANAAEAMDGLEVGMNWVGRGSSFLTSSTAEAPTGDTVGYDPNAFTWASHSTGSTQDIGVAEAWRLLELAGKLDNKVKIAILDMGFSNTNDFGSFEAYSNVPFITNPVEQSNLSNCGGPCPWHGTNVASSAFATADDGIGAAGPAGPVADPILVFTSYDFFTSISALAIARAAGADIANMSYGAAVPSILGFSVWPFEIATVALRASGMLIFAAAGNDDEDVDDKRCVLVCWEHTWHTPCENAGVICVGGLAYDNTGKSGGSNWGNEHVDIFAPYFQLVGQDPDNPSNHARLIAGTSFSSPFTAGVAALVWAADPSLSAGQVEDILMNTAHSSSDGKVRRYVNAADAVLAALGDAPPYVSITAPTNGASYARGSTSVSFSCTAEDLEDGTPAVTWNSSRDGEIGTGTSFSRTNLSVGSHVITATARDAAGQETSDTVTIAITNTPPVMTITSPSSGATFYRSQSISLQGTSYDPNELSALPNSSVRWYVDGGLLGTGHSRTIGANTLSVGSHNIEFRGDDGTTTASDFISITVQADPVNVPPSVAITSPSNGASWYVDQYDAARQQWYVEVSFAGTATDPEDGTLNGASVVWRAQASGHPVEILGTGRNLTARLYSLQPFGTPYTITLEATDSGDESSSTSITVTVNILS